MKRYRYGPFRKDGTRKREHVEIAERALGRELPPGVEVHHVDNDGLRNENSNLVICENVGYHRLLHMRTRVLQAGGDPDKDKICSTCRAVKAKTEFGVDRLQGDGLRLHCRLCWNGYCMNQKKRRRAEIAQGVHQ